LNKKYFAKLRLSCEVKCGRLHYLEVQQSFREHVYPTCQKQHDLCRNPELIQRSSAFHAGIHAKNPEHSENTGPERKKIKRPTQNGISPLLVVG
jgi:hypothetical protein